MIIMIDSGRRPSFPQGYFKYRLQLQRRISLRENCLNTESFLVRVFLYLDNFHAVFSALLNTYHGACPRK